MNAGRAGVGEAGPFHLISYKLKLSFMHMGIPHSSFLAQDTQIFGNPKWVWPNPC